MNSSKDLSPNFTDQKLYGDDFDEQRIAALFRDETEAFADEFLPLISRIDKLTILDPSDSFASNHEVHGVPCDYQNPDITGTLKFDVNSLDLVTSLSVPHHIPKISHVIEECHRCLRPGGLMLLLSGPLTGASHCI